MKNYIVKATRNFNDIEEKNEAGKDTPRIAGESVWNCTKERYEYLKENNAVVLMGIDEIKEEIPEEVKENVKKVINNQITKVEKKPKKKNSKK